MVARACDAVELRAFFKTNGNSVAPRQLDDFFRACVLSAFRYKDVLDRARGFKSFAHGMDSSQLVHGLTV
jgi:hypothetical protein